MFSDKNTADICRHETVHWSWSARAVRTLPQRSRRKWLTGAWNKIPHHTKLAFHVCECGDCICLASPPPLFLLLFSPGKLTGLGDHMFLFSLSESIKLFLRALFRLIRCNLKSKIPDSTFSDGIACMFCMAVWIKDWLSLLLSCSNLCPLSLRAGSGEFPKQSGLTFPGRYGLRLLNEWKCKAKENIKSQRMRQLIVIGVLQETREGEGSVHEHNRRKQKCNGKKNPHSRCFCFSLTFSL